MTFKDSDFPDVIEDLQNILDRCENPLVAFEVLKEAFRTYFRIPYYPGLVTMCTGAMVKDEKPDELQAGEFVAFKQNGSYFFGKVKKIDDNKLELERVTELEQKESCSVDLSKVAQLQKFNFQTLEELWPTLVFEGKE